jgi:CubicO group peptidase (beta-lactamase class C family)
MNGANGRGMIIPIFSDAIRSPEIEVTTMNTLRVFLILAALHLIGVSAYGQPTSAEVDQLVEEAMEKFHVAGVAVGIVKDGRIIHARGYGVKSVETNEPVDEYTSFAIASNSKAFTTTALAILVEEGKIRWTDRVVDHIPEFRMYNEYVTQNFNIQDLLTHRSGLGLGAGDLQIWPSGSDFTMKDLLTNFQYFEPISAFRTQYDYDNVLYRVAGEVIKRVSGMSWNVFVRKRILEPLEMDHSYTLPPNQIQSDNLAKPHLAMDGTLKIISYSEFDPEKTNGASSGVLSNAQDMCQWLLAHLNHGKYGEHLNKELFSKESQNEMWKIHTTKEAKADPRCNTHFAGYGLGWHLKDIHGLLCVWHSGDLMGMLSKTIMIPELQLGVVVLTNSYYGGEYLYEAVSQTIIDSYLGLEEFGWTAYYLERQMDQSGSAASVVAEVWETVESGNHDQVQIEKYLGTYEDPWFGTVNVEMKNGVPWFTSYRSPKLTGPMYHYKANTFAIKWKHRELDADAFAMFDLDEEGNAIHIRMKGISPDIDFSYDFQDLFFTRTTKP